MSDVITDPNAAPTEPAVTDPNAPASGLPSDAPNTDLIGGKWESTEQMLEHIKKIEDINANNKRAEADAIKASQASEADAAKSQEIAVKQQAVIDTDLMPEFMSNGMMLTDEMIAKAKEVGIDERDLKIGAYELKEKLAAGFEITGNKENYDAMMAWGKDNLSEAQKAAFDDGLHSNMSQYAIKGLWNDYQKALGDSGADNGRISGNPAPAGLTGYPNRKELYADKDYLATNAGRRDTEARKRYEARLNLTDNSVLGI